MRLLLATADPDLRLSLELLLSEQPGVQIVGAASEGDGLIALIHTTRPHMVLTDLDLPGQPISSVVTEARHIQPPAITIVLVAQNGRVQDARNAGADAVVPKGVPPDLLLSAFRRLQKKIMTNQEIDKYE